MQQETSCVSLPALPEKTFYGSFLVVKQVLLAVFFFWRLLSQNSTRVLDVSQWRHMLLVVYFFPLNTGIKYVYRNFKMFPSG